MFAVYRVEWIESERGWGIRPDGYSYHKTKEEANRYINEYWDGMPDEAPDEYSRPSEAILKEVSKELYEEVSLKNSVRVYNNKHVGDNK